MTSLLKERISGKEGAEAMTPLDTCTSFPELEGFSIDVFEFMDVESLVAPTVELEEEFVLGSCFVLQVPATEVEAWGALEDSEV